MVQPDVGPFNSARPWMTKMAEGCFEEMGAWPALAGPQVQQYESMLNVDVKLQQASKQAACDDAKSNTRLCFPWKKHQHICQPTLVHW